jgi:tape measure domain-containing protein
LFEGAKQIRRHPRVLAAAIRGAVNIKSLVSLTESGIPVFDLLGKAMNVSADRVRQLAESGKLGQDSIKLLVDQLGKLRAGASTAELGDLDSQLTKLKDVGREFLERNRSSLRGAGSRAASHQRGSAARRSIASAIRRAHGRSLHRRERADRAAD